MTKKSIITADEIRHHIGTVIGADANTARAKVKELGTAARKLRGQTLPVLTTIEYADHILNGEEYDPDRIDSEAFDAADHNQQISRHLDYIKGVQAELTRRAADRKRDSHNDVFAYLAAQMDTLAQQVRDNDRDTPDDITADSAIQAGGKAVTILKERGQLVRAYTVIRDIQRDTYREATGHSNVDIVVQSGYLRNATDYEQHWLVERRMKATQARRHSLPAEDRAFFTDVPTIPYREVRNTWPTNIDSSGHWTYLRWISDNAEPYVPESLEALEEAHRANEEQLRMNGKRKPQRRVHSVHKGIPQH